MEQTLVNPPNEESDFSPDFSIQSFGDIRLRAEAASLERKRNKERLAELKGLAVP
jgi:hypothetical protein